MSVICSTGSDFIFGFLKEFAFLAPEIIQNHSSARRNSATTLQPPIFHIFPVDQILFFHYKTQILSKIQNHSNETLSSHRMKTPLLCTN